jgi:hypothetical protein
MFNHKKECEEREKACGASSVCSTIVVMDIHYSLISLE